MAAGCKCNGAVLTRGWGLANLLAFTRSLDCVGSEEGVTKGNRSEIVVTPFECGEESVVGIVGGIHDGKSFRCICHFSEDTMDFSVVIPCHNASQWIVETLRSVASQTVCPKEIVVVDDASTDDSARQILESGVKVRLVSANVRNGAAARNVGAEAATGDWLAFLDADDCWYPDHLEKAQAVLQEASDVAFFSPVDRQFADGQVEATTNRWPPQKPTSGLSACECVRFWNIRRAWQTSTMVIKRDRYLAVGGGDADQQAGQDFEMWLRVIHGQTWSYCPSATGLYRAAIPGSVSRSNRARTRYFEMRGLTKNYELYQDCVPYRELVRRASVGAMHIAMLFPDRAYTPQVWEAARPWMPRAARVFFAVLRCFPRLYGTLYRIRGRIMKA